MHVYSFYVCIYIPLSLSSSNCVTLSSARASSNRSCASGECTPPSPCTGALFPFIIPTFSFSFLPACLAYFLAIGLLSRTLRRTGAKQETTAYVYAVRQGERERERGRARACTRGPVPSSTEAAARRRRPAVCLRSLSLFRSRSRALYSARVGSASARGIEERAAATLNEPAVTPDNERRERRRESGGIFYGCGGVYGCIYGRASGIVWV